MSHNGETQSHIGDQGEAWFFSALPRGWVWQTPRRDLGKDGLIVIRDGSKLHNIEFSFQIKSSEHPRVHGGNVLIAGVPLSSIRYWFTSPLPTLVVAVDISTRTGWYAWHLDLFDSANEMFCSTAKTVTLRIPQTNRLDIAGWTSIRTRLLEHFWGLYRAVSNDSLVPFVLATVHDIARIVGNIIHLSSSTPPEPPITQREGISILLEQSELRDLICTVRSLLNRLQTGSEAHKLITFWLTTFEEMAITGHPSLAELPPKDQPIPLDFTLTFAPKLLMEARPRLVSAAVDFIRLLTSSKPPE